LYYYSDTLLPSTDKENIMIQDPALLSPTYTKENMRATFDHVAAQTWQGIAGAIVLDTGIPGPILGVTAMTHGNEPAGLAAMRYALNAFEAGNITRGKIILTINNLAAAQRYWNATTFEENRASRFIDLNMNRLPHNTPDMKEGAPYEVRRVQQLLPLWRQFDVGYDVHSTSQPSEPMIVEISAKGANLLQSFPITTVIRNIVPVQLGVPASAFYGTPGRVACLEIEAGSHEDTAALTLAATCLHNLLISLGMAEGTFETPATPHKVYEVTGSLMFPNTSYELTRTIPMCSPITQGEVLATGDGPDIVAPLTGCALFAPKVPKPFSIAEEVLFYTKPMYQE
jgi:predicted deacylase